MDKAQKEQILQDAKSWFRESVAEKHVKNTLKLGDPAKLHINPFLVNYLANFLTGDNSAESIAKALIYPRVLGTSISTSFGTNIQKFASDVLDGFASVVSGIDIEFIDQLDGRRKYCQLKAGPNTINKDDVETLHGHFAGITRLARTNHLVLGYGDLVVGVMYGERSQLNSHYRRLASEYDHPVFVGQDFWHRLTGDETFYFDLVEEIASVATEIDGSDVIRETVAKLAASEAVQRLASKS